MKAIRLTLGAAMAAGALGGTASAEGAAGARFAYTIGVVSDYVLRGVSQTDEGPAVQGGIDLAGDIAYAGVWASNVDFGRKHTEVDLYGGVRPEAAGWTFDLGGIYYGYVSEPSNAHEAHFEFKAGASRALGPATIGGVVYFSPEFFGKTGDATYAEAYGAYAFNDRISASGAVGRQDVSYAGDYTTWNLGATWALAPQLAVDLRYYDTDEHRFGALYKGRGVVGLKATF